MPLLVLAHARTVRLCAASGRQNGMRAVGPTSLSTTAQSDFVRYCGGAIASGEAASACIVEYRGSANHGLDIGAVRANAAFGGDACVFYFEVDVLSASAGNWCVAVRSRWRWLAPLAPYRRIALRPRLPRLRGVACDAAAAALLLLVAACRVACVTC